MTFSNLPSYLLTAVVFLTMISILVAAHEYGHYLFARVFGMGVEEFAIGMGKKLAVWRRKKETIPVPDGYVHDPDAIRQGSAFEGGNYTRPDSRVVDTPAGRALEETTEFTIRMLPIGGFVRIKGMIPHEDGSEVGIPGGFYSKPPWQRLIVLIAGPAASVLSGLLVLIVLFMIHGVNKPIDMQPILGDVGDIGPAAKAGLKEGDRIITANSKPITNFYEFTQVISSHPGQPVEVEYRRGETLGVTSVTPVLADAPTLGPDLAATMPPTKHGLIGVSYRGHLVPATLGEATRLAIETPAEAITGLVRMVESPSTIKDEAGGALTMVAATHEATQEGISKIIWLACLLSISVGIFNLLPIPPLDGGQMAMSFAELLRGGKRLSLQVQQTLMSAGVMLVLALAVFIFFIDLQRFTGRGGDQPPKLTSGKQKAAR